MILRRVEQRFAIQFCNAYTLKNIWRAFIQDHQPLRFLAVNIFNEEFWTALNILFEVEATIE